MAEGSSSNSLPREQGLMPIIQGYNQGKPTSILVAVIGIIVLLGVLGIAGIFATQTLRNARAKNIRQRGLTRALRTDSNQSRKNYNAEGRDTRKSRRQTLRLCRAQCRGTRRKRSSCMKACLDSRLEQTRTLTTMNDPSSYLDEE